MRNEAAVLSPDVWLSIKNTAISAVIGAAVVALFSYVKGLGNKVSKETLAEVLNTRSELYNIRITAIEQRIGNLEGQAELFVKDETIRQLKLEIKEEMGKMEGRFERKLDVFFTQLMDLLKTK